MSRIGKKPVPVPTGVTVNLSGQNIAVKGPKGELKFVLVEHVLAKLEGGKPFRLVSGFQPAGDQPSAIAELVEGVQSGERNQVLLGATGTGKTFTMAKVIEATQRPAIILAPNKTLAAQLYGEFKGFFPENWVE